MARGPASRSASLILMSARSRRARGGQGYVPAPGVPPDLGAGVKTVERARRAELIGLRLCAGRACIVSGDILVEVRRVPFDGISEPVFHRATAIGLAMPRSVISVTASSRVAHRRIPIVGVSSGAASCSSTALT